MTTDNDQSGGSVTDDLRDAVRTSADVEAAQYLGRLTLIDAQIGMATEAEKIALRAQREALLQHIATDAETRSYRQVGRQLRQKRKRLAEIADALERLRRDPSQSAQVTALEAEQTATAADVASLSSQHEALMQDAEVKAQAAIDARANTGARDQPFAQSSSQRLKFEVPTAKTLMTMGRGRPGESHSGFSFLTDENHYSYAKRNLVMQSKGWSVWQSEDSAHVLSKANVIVGSTGGTTVAGKGGVNIIAGTGPDNPLAQPGGPNKPELVVDDELADDYTDIWPVFWTSMDLSAAVVCGAYGVLDTVVGWGGGTGWQKAKTAMLATTATLSAAGCVAADAIALEGGDTASSLSSAGLSGVTIAGKQGVLIGTPTWIGMYGLAGVTVVSLFSVLYGMVDASVLGLLSAGMASMKGSIGITAFKEVSIAGRKAVSIASRRRALTLEGKEIQIGRESPAGGAPADLTSKVARAKAKLAKLSTATQLPTQSVTVLADSALTLVSGKEASLGAANKVTIASGDKNPQAPKVELDTSKATIKVGMVNIKVDKGEVHIFGKNGTMTVDKAGVKAEASLIGPGGALELTKSGAELSLNSDKLTIDAGGLTFKGKMVKLC